MSLPADTAPATTALAPAEAPTTVVFDLGMVLLAWDRTLPYRAEFADAAALEAFLETVLPMDWHMRLDGGRDWEEALGERIALYPEHERLIRAYRDRYHETIPAAIEGTVAILEALHAAGVDLLALTNFPAEVFEPTRARFDFFRRFRGVVVSGDEKVMKPAPEIYRRLAERYGVDPRRAVFVDDRRDNVEAARALGFIGVVFESPEALADELRRLGLPLG